MNRPDSTPDCLSKDTASTLGKYIYLTSILSVIISSLALLTIMLLKQN